MIYVNSTFFINMHICCFRPCELKIYHLEGKFGKTPYTTLKRFYQICVILIFRMIFPLDCLLCHSPAMHVLNGSAWKAPSPTPLSTASTSKAVGNFVLVEVAEMYLPCQPAHRSVLAVELLRIACLPNWTLLCRNHWITSQNPEALKPQASNLVGSLVRVLHSCVTLDGLYFQVSEMLELW